MTCWISRVRKMLSRKSSDELTRFLRTFMPRGPKGEKHPADARAVEVIE